MRIQKKSKERHLCPELEAEKEKWPKKNLPRSCFQPVTYEHFVHSERFQTHIHCVHIAPELQKEKSLGRDLFSCA